MGFFSWFTSDTKKSIANNYSKRDVFPVHMITEDGQIFTENNYEGYGVFGGKDFYTLSAELNGYKGENDEATRDLFFSKIWKRGIRKGDKLIYHDFSGENGFRFYTEPIESEGGICANELVESHGWSHYDPCGSGDTEEFVKQGYKMPKLVEKLPSKENWKVEWNRLPYPESCPDQGYFYGEDDEDEDW
jgi:hypothetical protein